MTRNERYDAMLTEYETAIKTGNMTLSGALARAFILGMNYQTEVNRETAENEVWGKRRAALGGES